MKGSRSLRRAARGGLLWAALVLLPLPGPAAEKPDKALDQLLDQLLEKMRGDSSDILAALGQYSRIESSNQFDIFGRHRIHEGLLKALRERKDPEAAEAVETHFRSFRSNLPSQILAMKAIIAQGFPLPREKRVEWLAKMARERNQKLSAWGVHLLGDSDWPEAVDALIEILREEESDPESLLGNTAGSELYRVLGAAGLGTADRIRKNWEAMGRKIPERPDHGAVGGGRVTSSFFGDRISPRSVFAIDVSSSMRQPATLRVPGPGQTTADPKKRQGDEGSRRPKVEIVKEELSRALSGLRPSSRFNILGYNSAIFPWRGNSGSLRLHSATADTLKSADDFIRKLPTAEGTNIHDVLSAALQVPEVETVYLLSDGAPTRGGGAAEIERRVAALNYLAGIRIITYGFTPEGGGTFDEDLMKRLARRNWGWYRRLN